MQQAACRNTSNRLRVPASPAELTRFSWKCMTLRSAHRRTDQICCRCDGWVHCSRACVICTRWFIEGKCRLKIEKCRLKIENCKLQFEKWELQIDKRKLQIGSSSDVSQT